jgi:2-C-methyl-D-erythritol 4-phosphate cytidylyltransferase
VSKTLTAIIVAAGSSRRLGFDKLTACLAGKPLIAHTLVAFEATKSVDEIIVVTRKDRLAEFRQILDGVARVRAIVAGGEHRQNSVEAGLRHLNQTAEYVAVHDGARPLVRPEQIEEVFQQAQLHGAASLAEPVRDTLKRAGDDLLVRESIDRRHVYAMQTPQVFRRSLLEQAYQRIARSGQQVTDEVSAVELFGDKVMLVPNPEVNFKVTFERDLQLAEAVLSRRKGS